MSNAMNILAIASILPVPGIYSENDVIFRMYGHYRKEIPKDRITFWRPSVYSNAMFALMREKWRTFHRILKHGDYQYDDFRVAVLPFLDRKTTPGRLASLARSLWWMNKTRILRELESATPDVIHAHWLFPDGWLAFKLNQTFGIPYVLTLRRETDFLDDPGSRKAALEIIRHAKAVTVLNVRMKDRLVHHGYNKPVHLLPHGVEEPFFQSVATAISSIQRESVPAIITLSRFLDWKYLDRLIRALTIVAEKHRFTYTLVGDGPEAENINRLIRELSIEDWITILQPVPYDDVPDLLARHDLFALTSYPETFGRVYFEAMAVGLPVICSQNSGVAGFFEDGDAGLFVHHESVDDIANALVKLIADPELRREMGARGRALVSGYRWTDVVQSYRRIYEGANRL